ncbi:MAG: DNA mismatch repair protein MutS [Alicyclobacillus sp.]|nr:DNA mismatch repair protein MutS [Alicyclobacillus sp.]
MALTPMMQQYLDVKESYPDALLLFRLGDFYELFFDDALVASRVLEITLTGRDAGAQGRVPMCGVPYHAAEQYIGRLMEAGFCVAICEQMEDPKQAKGLVRREVTRVITPGTWFPDGDAERRLLAAVTAAAGDRYGAALLDVATGELWYGETLGPASVREVLQQWQPTEVLVSELEPQLQAEVQVWCNRERARCTVLERWHFKREESVERVCQQYGVARVEGLGMDPAAASTGAVARLLRYVQETQRQVLAHLKSPRPLADGAHMVVDHAVRRNLELTETQRTRQKRGSLFGLLDRTETAMGSRTLRRWLEAPLCDVSAIHARQDAVAWLLESVLARAEVRERLNRVYDLERLAAKVGFGSAGPRDLVAVAQSLVEVPRMTALLRDCTALRLRELGERLPDLTDLAERVLSTLESQPPASIQDGGMVRQGVDSELDELRLLHSDGKQWLANFEAAERERTGIKSLKVGFNKVFGYYIEVSKANVHLVPPDYQRKQTLTAAERYTVPALKAQEDRILHAEERAIQREIQIFTALRDEVAAALPAVQRTAEVLAEMDALAALAETAADRGYVRPRVRQDKGIWIANGRHPMVEAATPGRFVPNSVRLDAAGPFILLTGPNMAGKSTYMRQTALIVLMAQMGSFVPADEAEVGVVDRIFTRIGASDDLGSGQSTFMVEMVELAQILRQATERSLILLDEIGRGTSTYDGMSIAEAVMEQLVQSAERPLTLFATHYHELTARAADLLGVRNCSVAVQESAGEITFLHTVVERPADRSYGIQVARLAGVPGPVIARARTLLAEREMGRARADLHGSDAAAAADAPGRLGAPATSTTEGVPPAVSEWLASVAALEVERMTPIEAIAALDQVVRQAREVETWAASR